MLLLPIIKRLRLPARPSALLLLAINLPYAFAEPTVVNIDNEHIHINSITANEAIYNITNGGSLTVSNSRAGFTSRRQTHSLSDATLKLGSGAIFSGDINSNNSHIMFSGSTYTGNILASPESSLGDVYINSSTFNGGIRTGSNNANYTVAIKDSEFNGQGIISPLAIYSGRLNIENSDFNNHNFPVIDIRNSTSAVLKNATVNSTSDYNDANVIGISGIYLQDVASTTIMDSTIVSDGTAVRAYNSVNAGDINILFIGNSTLKAKAAAALEARNSDIIIYESTLTTGSNGDTVACYTGSSAINGCGALNLAGSTAIVSQRSALNSDNVGVFITGSDATELDISNSSVHAEKAAFSVNSGNATISVRNSHAALPSVVSNEGVILEALNNSQVDLSLSNVNAKGDIYADESSRVRTSLKGASWLEGSIFGANKLEVSREATWKMTADNHIKELLFTGGTVRLPDASPDNQFHTLTIDSLTGSGHFALNTNLQTMQGDKLHITKDLFGAFTLGIANSGAEPDDPDAILNVIQGPSSTALFSLYGGKVDAGVWQYNLVQKGNDWYLVNSHRSEAPDMPGTPDAPDMPGTPDTPDAADGDSAVVPQPSLTPSAKTLLNMAAAPVYIFNNELQNRRQRRGESQSKDDGVWGRYLQQNTYVTTEMNAWRLAQNGFELGGDKAIPVQDGRLQVGLLASITSNAVRHESGTTSQVNSYSAGAYASWFKDNGMYMDAVIKANRFNNQVYTRMSNGVAVNGSYNQNGVGGALESGWRVALANNYWAEPFFRVTAFRAGSKNVTLSNGMTAHVRHPASAQVQTGLHLGKRLELNKAVLSPYLKASVAKEFVKSSKVRLNHHWDFNDAAAGSAARYGAGIDIWLAKEAALFSEINYQNGRYIESPLAANLGLRIGF